MPEEIKLGTYLLNRVSQLGTKSVFGVPGDFSLGFLDLVEDHKELKWVGNANELNAAYAADGYARINQKLAALVTTFGVGELSAVNGVAGSFAERLPVVHIVGVPSTEAQGQHALLHHTLGDGRFEAFEKMSAHITAASVKLGEVDIEDAPRAIDRALATCVRDARPVYITIPSDLVHTRVSSASLSKPIDTSSPPNDADVEAFVLKEIISRVRSAKDPIILTDACCLRHHVVAETNELVDRSGLPVFSSPMGKTAVDEHHQQYGGVYVGNISEDKIKKRVESADCVISIGALLSDFNTGSFSYRTPRSATIELHSDYVQIGYAHYSNVGMKELLPKISSALSEDQAKRLEHTLKTVKRSLNPLPTQEEEGDVIKGDSQVISHAWFWPRIGQAIQEKDQVVVETGTASFGSIGATLPSHSIFVSQVLWGSIGWSVGATLGVAIAAKEAHLGRTHLFVGDGSLQLTVQEIGTMIRQGLTPTLWVLSNRGYSIEREIHGRDRVYNDIGTWNHAKLLEFLSPPEGAYGNSADDKAQVEADFKAAGVPLPSKTAYFAVKTKKDVDDLLKSAAYNAKDTIKLIEVFMKRDDAPIALRRQAEMSAGANSYD